MQAKYRKAKVVAAANRTCKHYLDEAAGLRGKDKEFAMRKAEAASDIQSAARLAEPGSVMLNQAEIKLLANFWDKPGGE